MQAPSPPSSAVIPGPVPAASPAISESSTSASTSASISAPAAPLPEVQSDSDYQEVKELPSGHNDKAAFMAKLGQMRKPALSALINNAFHIERNDNQVAFYFDINHANLIPLIRSARNRGHLSGLIREFYGPNMILAWYATNNPNFTKASDADAALRAKVSAHPIVKHIIETYKGSIISCQVMQKKQKKKEQSK